MPTVDSLMGRTGDVGEGVERLEGQEILDGILRGSDDAEPLCDMEVVYLWSALYKWEVHLLARPL